MKIMLSTGTLALLACACGGPDEEYYCTQSFHCSSGGNDGTPEVLTEQVLEHCEDGFLANLDECKQTEVDAIEDAIETCKPKTACDFILCIAMTSEAVMECLVPDPPESECGDGFVDPLEHCDGSDLWGQTCSSLTQGEKPEGTLGCTDLCTYDRSDCR